VPGRFVSLVVLNLFIVFGDKLKARDGGDRPRKSNKWCPELEYQKAFRSQRRGVVAQRNCFPVGA